MAPKTSFEHELTTRRSPDRSKTRLIDGANSAKDDALEYSRTSRIYDCLRLFRLQLMGKVFSWRAPLERRKIAIFKSRRLAAYHTLLHVVPLGGALGLLIINGTSTYVGPGGTRPTATSLQFIAKLHELLMQNSIVEVIFAIVRTQVVNGYVPLGALSASMHVFQLSYIWSLDFVSAVTSQAFLGWRKVLFATLVPLLMVLAALVGPSSAVLMIPRSGLSRTVGRPTELFARSSAASLFPSHVNNTHSMNFTLERFVNAYSFPDLSMQGSDYSGYESATYNSDNGYVHRLLRTSTSMRRAPTAEDSSVSFYSTTAAIPTQLAATNMHNTRHGWENSTIMADIPHPVVVTRCTLRIPVGNSDTMLHYVQDDGISQGQLSTVGQLIETYIGQGGSKETMMDLLPPIWSMSPEQNSSALIGTFPNFGFSLFDDCNYNQSQPYPISEMFAETKNCFKLTTCSISAFWATSKNEMAYIGGSSMAQTPPFKDAGFKKVTYGDPIVMNLTHIPSFNNANFTRIFQGSTLEPILTAVFATALANVPGDPTLRDQSTRNVIPQQFTDLSASFKFETIQYGYGYDTSPTSVRLSFVVLAIYCIVTTGYLLYILITGHTSTAWNSAMELVLLGLQSNRPNHLGHASVGVESMETLRKGVGIRVNDNEDLELVFADDRDGNTREMGKIVANKAY